ncbi:p-loop containing nucleoside triphosphate hydrolase [Venustampulla echinocandica]|uniref:DNA 3'-5' helicase n=1 Tax=Venustampulla echinocandica TaxID=2656787 RepID=A0A370U1W1_9HELO|nr:p-loop containing nucleoside triphosphate hydrolase [Venustampulla echinocandica]RDL41758.1 p-loop containing nucleoside triphosphate hydrolase [Venustampulla echinocandica]
MDINGILANLNSSQHAAVSSAADTLAILAGPGSGKTHTLTSRTAWLLAQGLQPWNIIVATFTVKSAREMKERIGKLIGNGLESKLILGTFHSIARRYLARYGHLIDIKKDFGIADSADSLAIIKRIIKRNRFMIDPKVARNRISGHKSRDQPPGSQKTPKSVEAQEFEICFTEYEAALKISNLLDYDDLLLRCVELLRSHPSCISNVEAVLIDEFQDTNLVQFDLMRLFAAERKRITIVGDPDQSIYGFRAAEIKNYKRMLRQYPDTVTIALEENYRSSGSILLAALGVIEQDTSRVARLLMPTHTVGTRPVLRKLSGAYKEAEWIVMEIQRCRGLTGNLLDLNDIAILLRSASLSRLIETALGKAGIAYKMVGGLRFYDRVEIKTILDYLRVINQPDNNDALARIINTPSRRIGEATIKLLLEEANRGKVSLWSLILRSVQGNQTLAIKLQKQAEQGLSKLVNMIITGGKKLAGTLKERSTITEIIEFVIEKTDYEKWLEVHHDDVHKGRWDNVQELITQASDFQDLVTSGYEDETLPHVEGLKQEDDDNYLSRFLANVALASEVKNSEEEGAPIAQVTISTIHAAKGLEWPVVFIPATYQGSIPHSRAEDGDEERRLLYVAMTRAQALLYMSYPLKSSSGEAATLSPFLAPPSTTRLLEKRGPSLGSHTVQSISQILRRDLPSVSSISESCSSLRSIEDDIFPVDGEDSKEAESKFNSLMGIPTFSLGQQAPKRRRVELGRSMSNIEGVAGQNWKPSYTTTMDRASTMGFVSAGSHLEVLNEQSINGGKGLIQDGVPKLEEKILAGKTKAKVLKGQGNLLAFVGKPQPDLSSAMLHPTESTVPRESKMVSQAPKTVNCFNRPRIAASTSERPGITPALAAHRLGPSQIGSRPRLQVPETEPQRRNEYVFLSSSPPRPQPVIPDGPHPPETPAGLTTKPPLLPLIRPALSMHTTSISILNGSMATKKTLGVKRSLDGWSSRKGQSFVPPSQKRP